MIYRGCCDRFMCFRQPSERWRHVHQGYWALSSFTLEEEEEAHTLSPNLFPTKEALITCTDSLSRCTFDFEVGLLIWKSFMGSLYSISPPPPSLVGRGWWTEGAPLTAVRLASVRLFPQSLSSSGEWSIRSKRQWSPSQAEKTKFEPIIIMAYCTQEER